MCSAVEFEGGLYEMGGCSCVSAPGEEREGWTHLCLQARCEALPAPACLSLSEAVRTWGWGGTGRDDVPCGSPGRPRDSERSRGSGALSVGSLPSSLLLPAARRFVSGRALCPAGGLSGETAWLSLSPYLSISHARNNSQRENWGVSEREERRRELVVRCSAQWI